MFFRWWKGVRGGPWLDTDGTLQLLDSDHVRWRDKALREGGEGERRGEEGCPCFQGVNGGSPWANDPAEGAGNLLECALGSYTS